MQYRDDVLYQLVVQSPSRRTLGQVGKADNEKFLVCGHRGGESRDRR